MAKCKECLHFDVCEALENGNGIKKVHPIQCGCFKPAADVVEVKRGKWEVTEHREHINVICSNCNEDFYVYKKGQYRIDRSNYCPKCGARMERDVSC